jgi:UMF1 family MFS transporter
MKNNPKVTNAWCWYDWANSVFSLTIATAIFPQYFISVTGGRDADIVLPFGTFSNSALYSYAVSFSFLLAAILSPGLAGIADSGGLKKRFMQFFCYLGALSCAALFFFTKDTGVAYGAGFFILASIGFSGSIVFYNSYLPLIATEDQYDRISAKGYSLGYIGSVLLLIVNLGLITFTESIGGDVGFVVRLSFLSVGLWWAGFSLIPFIHLPKAAPVVRMGNESLLLKGFKELSSAFSVVLKHKLLSGFLLAFFFYNMGVQTTMYLAQLFAEEVIRVESSELILTILIIQLVAIAGAAGFNKLSSLKGNTFALQIGLVIWIAICLAAWIVVKGWSFYVLAGTIGLVMGGIQSLSRATFSKLLPQDTEDTASFFSFYDFCEKISIALGTFIFGYIRDWTGDMRNNLFFLLGLFIIGLLLLLRIPSRKSYAEESKQALQG